METVVGMALGLVVGAFLSLLGTRYLWLLQRERMELGYEVLSSHVIIPKLAKPTPDIRVVVRAALIGEGDNTQEYLPVDEIRGFRVKIRNTGNTVIEGQRIIFELDNRSKAISLEPEDYPDLGGREIVCSVQLSESNVATAVIPFLNPGMAIIFSLQSVNNDSFACRVTAGAPGLVVYSNAQRRSTRVLALVAAGTIALAVPPGVLKLVDLSSRFRPGGGLDTYMRLSLSAGALVVLVVVLVAIMWLFDLLTRRFARAS